MLSIRRLAIFVLSGLVLVSFSAGAVVNEINDLKVVPGEGKLRLEISKVGNVKYDAFKMHDPERFVLDCVGAKYDIKWNEKEIDSQLAYRIRTSQFKVDPILVSRIVLDLKQNVQHQIWDDGDRLIVELTAQRSNVSEKPLPDIERLVVPAAKKKEAAEKSAKNTRVVEPPAEALMGPILPLVTPLEGVKEKKADSFPVIAEKQETYTSPWIEEAVTQKIEPAEKTPEQKAKQAQEQASEAPKPQAEKTELAAYESYAWGAPATGGGLGMGSRRITLDAQGADIKTVLRTISDFAGVNIVAGSKVKGDVYVHIKDAPWEEALDVLLKAYGYGYREEFGMIRVAEMKELIKEELDQQTAEKKKEDLLPLVTKIVFVDNSSAEELREALQNVVTNRGEVDVDLGSNAIIINDIERNVDKIEQMIKDLDRKVYQVDINAKLVEIDVEATRDLGINWGLLNLHASGSGGVGEVVVDADIPLTSGTVKYGTVRSWGELTMMLQMLEESNKANIISNPRITTMDNREASILVGKEIPLIVADEAGNPITELTKIGIMLRVIPHVNADRTITLDLHPEVSDLQSEAAQQGGVIITTSEADTRVIVGDGETAVIGGLIKTVETELRTGIPYLKDLPGIGWLFSSSTKADKKQELVIFVTPTIVE